MGFSSPATKFKKVDFPDPERDNEIDSLKEAESGSAITREMNEPNAEPGSAKAGKINESNNESNNIEKGKDLQ